MPWKCKFHLKWSVRTRIWSKWGSWPNPSTDQPDTDTTEQHDAGLKEEMSGDVDWITEGCPAGTVMVVTDKSLHDLSGWLPPDEWTFWKEHDVSGGNWDEPPYQKPSVIETQYFIKYVSIHDESDGINCESFVCIPEELYKDFEKFLKYFPSGQVGPRRARSRETAKPVEEPRRPADRLQDEGPRA